MAICSKPLQICTISIHQPYSLKAADMRLRLWMQCSTCKTRQQSMVCRMRLSQGMDRAAVQLVGHTCGWLPGKAPHESLGMAKPAIVQQLTCTAPYLRPAMAASNACPCSACTATRFRRQCMNTGASDAHQHVRQPGGWHGACSALNSCKRDIRWRDPCMHKPACSDEAQTAAHPWTACNLTRQHDKILGIQALQQPLEAHLRGGVHKDGHDQEAGQLSNTMTATGMTAYTGLKRDWPVISQSLGSPHTPASYAICLQGSSRTAHRPWLHHCLCHDALL